MELNEFTQLFPNEDCCYEYLSFWVKNICCTNCGSKGLVWHKETKRWECPVCGFVISLETMFSLLRDYFPYDAGEIIWQYNYLMKKQMNHSTEDTNHTPTREKVVYGSTEGEYAGSSSHKCDIYIPNAPKAGTTYENVAGSTIIPGALITIGIGGILGGLFSTKSHTVYSSVFAPAEVARGNDMMVQVYVYKDGEHEQVIKDAISADDSTSERRKKYDPLYFKLKEGDKVEVSLNIIGTEIDCHLRTFVWKGRYTCCAFHVHVPRNFNRNILFGEVLLSVNGATLGELQFKTNIAPYPDMQGTASVVSHPIKKVFISYAHEDAVIVRQQASAYDLADIPYFLDDRTLRSGDVYNEKIFEHIRSSDLFILFWSSNAASSEYVKKEYQYAMSLAYPQVEPEDATLLIHPASIKPYAEYPEDLKEIYHFTKI